MVLTLENSIQLTVPPDNTSGGTLVVGVRRAATDAVVAGAVREGGF
jgi:hypothetical protein